MAVETLLLIGLALGEAQQNKNPYQDLFRVPPLTETAAQKERLDRAREQLLAAQRGRVPPGRPQPKVVCGLLVIPADPSVDPRMLIDPTARSMHSAVQPKYTIRSVPPPVCAPE